MTKQVNEDPVVVEIHAIRQLLLDQCGGDINEYRKRVRERQESSGRPVITKPFRNRTDPPRPLEPADGVVSHGKSSPPA